MSSCYCKSLHNLLPGILKVRLLSLVTVLIKEIVRYRTHLHNNMIVHSDMVRQKTDKIEKIF